jgi:hypothetical protein
MSSTDGDGTPDVDFPSGSWTLWFHDPDDTNWTPASYKKLGRFATFGALWGALNAISTEHFLGGMYFFMRGDTMPLWEHRSNIHGGSYCIKVPEAVALETFHRYVASAILGCVTTDAANAITGVTISPKKGFHILKIWNSSCKLYHLPHEIHLLGEGMKATDVLYRPHTDAKF